MPVLTWPPQSLAPNHTAHALAPVRPTQRGAHVPRECHATVESHQPPTHKITELTYFTFWGEHSRTRTSQIIQHPCNVKLQRLVCVVYIFADRTILLWSAKHLDQKEHKNLRVNVEFDHATLVRWSPDSKAFIIYKAVENAVEVYKVNKKADGWIGAVTKAITFPKAHVEDAVGMDIAANGRFIMTCSEKTDLVLWDLKGERLATLDTLTVQTYCAKVSPCGKFVAASGFSPDVKLWEVLFSKSGDFDKVSRAYELKGHNAGVFDLAFSADSSRVATISKDGSWRVFDINIEYRKGEDPHLLKTGTHPCTSAAETRLALSPDGESFAVSNGSDLYLYVVQSGKLVATIKDIYTGSIRQVRFDSTGSLVLTAGDRHVRVFHNVAHYAATVEVNGAKLKQTGLSAATKERLTELIAGAKKFLADNNVE